jgi:hypothetical protein
MSAFKVNAETLYDVIHLIAKTYGGGQHYEKNQLIKALSKNNPKKLFNQLAKLNDFSLLERYGEDGNDWIKDFKFEYLDFINNHSNNYQLLKSTSCYLYQSCEGKADKRPLFRCVESMRDEFALHILSRLPQYEQAKWGH